MQKLVIKERQLREEGIEWVLWKENEQSKKGTSRPKEERQEKNSNFYVTDEKEWKGKNNT